MTDLSHYMTTSIKSKGFLKLGRPALLCCLISLSIALRDFWAQLEDERRGPAMESYVAVHLVKSLLPGPVDLQAWQIPVEQL
jgi:hypothetical protein